MAFWSDRLKWRLTEELSGLPHGSEATSGFAGPLAMSTLSEHLPFGKAVYLVISSYLGSLSGFRPTSVLALLLKLPSPLTVWFASGRVL